MYCSQVAKNLLNALDKLIGQKLPPEATNSLKYKHIRQFLLLVLQHPLTDSVNNIGNQVHWIKIRIYSFNICYPQTAQIVLYFRQCFKQNELKTVSEEIYFPNKKAAYFTAEQLEMFAQLSTQQQPGQKGFCWPQDPVRIIKAIMKHCSQSPDEVGAAWIYQVTWILTMPSK